MPGRKMLLTIVAWRGMAVYIASWLVQCMKAPETGSGSFHMLP